MRKAKHAVLLLLAASPLAAPALAQAYVPTKRYERRDVRGFAVLVSPEVRARPAEETDALGFIDLKLGDIVRLLPARDVLRLRRVTIWIEREEEPLQASTYNPSARWLSEHGRNPDKARGVEITNLRHFLDWGRTDQPMELLHEMAHAFHDQALGSDYAPIRDAYRHALESHLYESVPYVHGGLKRAYALTNEREFFAELSEAYFGRNDFYPFTRSDLRTYDPVGYRLMQDAWSPSR